MAACAETGTVVNLHIGSSGSSPSTTEDAPPDVQGVLFFAYAISAAVDWLYSGLPSRFPDLKICLSEGGIGWVAGLLDRLDHMLSYHAMYGPGRRWVNVNSRRGFHPQFLVLRGGGQVVVRAARPDRYGQHHAGADYPHCDSTWPHTNKTIHEEIGDLPDDAIRKFTWENAFPLVPASGTGRGAAESRRILMFERSTRRGNHRGLPPAGYGPHRGPSVTERQP